jgi:hypothetical protein
MLKQGGGLLEFIDQQTGVQVRRRQIYIQWGRGPWNLGTLLNETTRLVPDTSIDVHHTLFSSGTSVEKLKMEGFAVGGEYKIELRQNCGIGRWLREGKLKHAFRKIYSGNWNGEPEWERCAIPVIQRDLLDELAFKVLKK